MITLHEMKNESESTPDLNTPGFEPGTRGSEDECATARPSALSKMSILHDSALANGDFGNVSPISNH